MKTAEEYKAILNSLVVHTESPSAIKVSAYKVIELILKDMEKETNVKSND